MESIGTLSLDENSNDEIDTDQHKTDYSPYAKYSSLFLSPNEAVTGDEPSAPTDPLTMSACASVWQTPTITEFPRSPSPWDWTHEKSFTGAVEIEALPECRRALVMLVVLSTNGDREPTTDEISNATTDSVTLHHELPIAIDHIGSLFLDSTLHSRHAAGRLFHDALQKCEYVVAYMSIVDHDRIDTERLKRLAACEGKRLIVRRLFPQ
jgi:hypothetical protein